MTYAINLPIKAGLLTSLRYWVRQWWRRLRCPHTHTFVAPIESVAWYSSGEKMGRHSGLLLRGCYLCGMVEVYDHQA